MGGVQRRTNERTRLLIGFENTVPEEKKCMGPSEIVQQLQRWARQIRTVRALGRPAKQGANEARKGSGLCRSERTNECFRLTHCAKQDQPLTDHE
jgi:hypothetical protein